MRLTKLTNPQTLPVSLDSIKTHLRIELDESGYDADLTELIRAAAAWVQTETHITLVATQLRATWDSFVSEVIRLPMWPVTTVDSITYLDLDGASQTLSTSLYRTSLVQCPATIRPAINEDWPDTLVDGIDTVSVNVTAGLDAGSDEIQMVKHLIKLLVGHWFKNREAVLTGQTSKEIELAVQSLVNQTRVNEFVEFIEQ